MPLGLIQPAWRDAVPAPGQTAPGTVRFRYRANDTMLVRTRRAMPTTIVLPACERIERVIPGDEDSFPWEVPEGAPNVLVVRADRVGVDVGLHVLARSGRLYSFVLWAEGVEAAQVSDLKAIVDDPDLCGRASATRAVSIAVGDGGAGSIPRNVAGAPSVRRTGFGREGPEEQPADFARRIPYAPEDLDFDSISVSAPDEASRVLGPLRAFHDRRRTFLDYGDRLESVRAPVPFVTVDGIDQPVDFHWAGARGQIMVIHAVGELITLKSGLLHLCVRNGWRPQPAASDAAAVGPMS